ncbi:MAG: hypothetical protein H0V17_34000 [Deltaproteobacteria bacterium]|nr:hypothetical protein [Deltaproteobacteria bacterium]
MRNLSITLLLGLVATTGCAADAQGDDPADPNDPADPDDPQPVPTSPEGTFAMTSTFDVATNAPGTPGTVANYFINATDDPDDPTKFILDELIKAMPDGSAKNFLTNSTGFVSGYLNDRLLDIAPDFVAKLIDMGDAFGQVTKNFGTSEVLVIDAGGKATKTIKGLKFKIDNVDMEFPFADYSIEETKIENLTVTLSPTGQIAISQHTVPMKYGQVLRLAIDQAVIPMVDPASSNLGEVLKGLVNCQAVGQYVFEAIDFGSPSTFESACNSGLTAAGGALYKALDNMDSAALQFNLTGAARGVDKNQDGKMDDIQTGLYTGELSYAGSPAPLAGAKFFGTRM